MHYLILSVHTFMPLILIYKVVTSNRYPCTLLGLLGPSNVYTYILSCQVAEVFNLYTKYFLSVQTALALWYNNIPEKTKLNG